jgi:hypothetical protein
VQGAGYRVQGAGCRVQGAGCRVQGAGCRVQGAGCRVQGSLAGAGRCEGGRAGQWSSEARRSSNCGVASSAPATLKDKFAVNPSLLLVNP